jgi:hypothetical protein
MQINPIAVMECPTCKAQPGYKCFTKTGKTLRHSYHVSRVKRAEGALQKLARQRTDGLNGN